MTEPTMPLWAVVNPRCGECGLLLNREGKCAMEPHDEEECE